MADRNMSGRARDVLIAVAGLALAAAGLARAADYPSHPIRVIVPYTPGSATDIVPRTVLQQVSAQIGQPIVVENRPGRRLDHRRHRGRQGRPGRLHDPGPLQRHRHHAGDPGECRLRPGAGLFRHHAARQRAAGAGDLAGQEDQDRPGDGRARQVEGGRIQLRVGRHRHAAASDHGALPPGCGLRGPARALQGRAGGADRSDDRPHRHLFLPDHAGAAAHPRGQAFGAGGVGAKRSAALPDVPTTIEAGYPDSDFDFWIGLFAPAKTPHDIVAKFYQETTTALESPAVKGKLATLGVEPMPLTSEQFQAEVVKQASVAVELAKAAGLSPAK